MSFRTTGATNVWEGFCRNNATTGRKPPDPYPITVMWWVYIDSLVATYASFMLMGPLNWEFGPNNWIASIGPFGPGAANAFAMSANGADNDTGVLLSGNTGRWLCQAIRTRKDGSNAIHEYYPDLLGKPRTFGSQTVALPYFSGVQSNTLFFMGCPPWADQEGLNGKLGGVKIWKTWLPHGAILQERGFAYPVLRQYSRQVYGVYPARLAFKNLNSSAGGNDILFDVSGNANHFYQSTSADNYAAGDTGGCESWGDAPIVQAPPTRPQDQSRRLFIVLPSGVSAALTGQSIASAQGTLSPDASKALSGQVGTLSQGTIAPALNLSATGQGIAASLGTLSQALSVALSGQALASAQGTLSASSDVTAALTGISLSSALGTLSPALAVAMSGQGLTGAQGSMTPVIGVFVELTGQALSAALGSLAPALDAALNGTEIVASVGTLSVPIAAFETFTGGFFVDFDRQRERRRKRLRELEEAEEAAQQLKDNVDQEIAQLLQEQERKAEFEANISRLKRLVGEFADKEAEAAMSERVRKALARAQAQESVSAYLSLQRELERMLEEEEFAVLMILAQ